MQFVRPLAIVAGISAFAFLGCKTEVNTPPPQQTVIREEAPPARTEVVHEHDNDATPKVENNIKVDR